MKMEEEDAPTDLVEIKRIESAPELSQMTSSDFANKMVMFRRSSSSQLASAERAIALVNKMQRRLSMALDSSAKTLSDANSILEEAGQAIQKMFEGLSGEALSKAIQREFSKFDTDGTGLLDRGEFAKAMHSLGLRLTGAQLDLLFKEYDTDGSGQIDLTEFTNMVNKCIKKSANKKMREEVVAKFQSRWVSSGATIEENMIKWDSSASTMQKLVRGRHAIEYLNKLRRSITIIQKGMRGLRDRRSVKRMRGEDPDAFYYMLRRYTELRLTVPEILASVPLISKLSTHERRLLTEHLAWRSYGKDSTIVLEGEPSDSMIIIMKGTARVVRGPDRIEVLQFKSGSFFGENALTVGGTVRHASVETNGPTLCIEITRDAYELCLKASSEASASGEIVQNSIQKAAEEAATVTEGQVPNYLKPQSVRVRRHQEAIRQARAPQERDRPENIGFSRAASTSSIPEDKDVSELLPRISSEGDLLRCDIRVTSLESNTGKGYEVRTPRPPREKPSSAAPRPGHTYNPRLPLQLMGSSAAEADGDDGFTRTASCPAPKTGAQRRNSLSIVGPNFRPLLSHRENRDFMGLRQNARLQRIYAKSISGLTSPLSPSSRNVGLEFRDSAGTQSNDCWGLVNTALQNMDDPESQAAAITRQSAADAFGIRRLHSASGRLPSYSFTSNAGNDGILVPTPPNRRSSVHEIITHPAHPMQGSQSELPSRSRSSHNLSGHFVTPFRRISSAGPQRTTSSDSSSNMVQLPRVRKTPFVIDLVDLRG